MVELALVSPLVFFFIFVTIEFGRMLMVYHGLEEAAREGCRVAIVPESNGRDVRTVVRERLATVGLSETDFTMPVHPKPFSTADQWAPVTVGIVATYGDVSWLPTPDYLKNIRIRGSCTLPREIEP